MRSDITVVTPLLDEEGSVDALLASLLEQEPAPAAVVVADGGSTDGTLDRVRAVAARDPRVVLLTATGGRSAGRNRGVDAAPTDRIACIDGGCIAEPGWLEGFARAFEDGATFVAGFYRPVGPTARSTAIGAVMVPSLAEVDPATFQPSARSVAFTREAWAAAGGFPEDLQFAEDTLFDERVVAAGHPARFVPTSVVRWTPPRTYRVLARTMFRWGRGDGAAGLRGHAYRRLAAVIGASGLAVVVLGLLAPAVAVLGAAPLALHTLRNVRGTWPTVPPASRPHLLLAQVIHTLAVTVGFVVGRLRDRGPR